MIFRSIIWIIYIDKNVSLGIVLYCYWLIFFIFYFIFVSFIIFKFFQFNPYVLCSKWCADTHLLILPRFLYRFCQRLISFASLSTDICSLFHRHPFSSRPFSSWRIDLAGSTAQTWIPQSTSTFDFITSFPINPSSPSSNPPLRRKKFSINTSLPAATAHSVET